MEPLDSNGEQNRINRDMMLLSNQILMGIVIEMFSISEFQIKFCVH